MIQLLAIAYVVMSQSPIPTTGSWGGKFHLTEPIRMMGPLTLGHEIRVSLTWTQPDETKSWIIYDNGAQILECFGEPRVVLRHVSPGKHEYYVTAKKTGVESDPSNKIIIDTFSGPVEVVVIGKGDGRRST